jgi:hypothetical protein
MVVGSIGSLKVAVTAVLVATPVAPLDGVTDVTIGGVGAGAAVVNDQVKLAAIGVPASSFTPDVPPTTVAVYVVELARASAGISLAVWAAAS